MEYNGEKKLSVWLFSKFSQFIDYILGIMLQGIKGAIVGWTAIVEGMVNDILNLVNNNLGDNIINTELVDNIINNSLEDNTINNGI